jgi:hypothetical protein
MDAQGLMVLATTGGLGVAVAILVTLSILGRRRRIDTADADPRDAEMAAARRSIQADIDAGQRGY